MSGWLVGTSSWGRPVDVAVDASGAILVSDDASGTIYKLTYTAPPPPPPTAQAVTSFTLINADTDLPIAGYDPLRSGATRNLATLPTRNLSIRANSSPSVVGSVVFGYDANPTYRIETGAPYAIAGDNGGTDYLPWTPAAGGHTLVATPYSGANATGTAGTKLTIQFTVSTKRRGKN